MQKLDNRRKRFAWLLLLVYIPIVLVTTFHHHPEAEAPTTFYCYDCAHHINHEGHLTVNSSFDHDCVLCQLFRLPYVVPSIIKIAACAAIAYVVFCVACPFVKTREANILSTRAPPVL